MLGVGCSPATTVVTWEPPGAQWPVSPADCPDNRVDYLLGNRTNCPRASAHMLMCTCVYMKREAERQQKRRGWREEEEKDRLTTQKSKPISVGSWY